jgi:hypothetical protein
MPSCTSRSSTRSHREQGRSALPLGWGVDPSASHPSFLRDPACVEDCAVVSRIPDVAASGLSCRGPDRMPEPLTLAVAPSKSKKGRKGGCVAAGARRRPGATSVPPPARTSGCLSRVPTGQPLRPLTSGLRRHELNLVANRPPSKDSKRGDAAEWDARRATPSGPGPRPRTPAGSPRRSGPCQKPRPMRTRGTSFPATPRPRRPANWGSAVSRRAHVSNPAVCVHAGLAFRHPPVPWGRFCQEPRAACTRGSRSLTWTRPQLPSSRQDAPVGWPPCRKSRGACTRGTNFLA